MDGQCCHGTELCLCGVQLTPAKIPLVRSHSHVQRYLWCAHTLMSRDTSGALTLSCPEIPLVRSHSYVQRYLWCAHILMSSGTLTLSCPLVHSHFRVQRYLWCAHTLVSSGTLTLSCPLVHSHSHVLWYAHTLMSSCCCVYMGVRLSLIVYEVLTVSELSGYLGRRYTRLSRYGFP